METLCGKNQSLGEDAADEIPAWCNFNQNSLIDPDNRCISIQSGRGVQITYTSCDTLNSALCESTKKLCHAQVTLPNDFDTTKSIYTPTLKGDNQSSRTTNTTTGRYHFSNLQRYAICYYNF